MEIINNTFNINIAISDSALIVVTILISATIIGIIFIKKNGLGRII